MTACDICGREPHTVNNAVSECSHVGCPHRSRSWAVDHVVEHEPEPLNPLDELFGEVCPYCGIRTDEPCDEPPIDTCERALNVLS
jgi:hypothetical protein